MMLKRAILVTGLTAAGFLAPLASTLAQQSAPVPGPAGAPSQGPAGATTPGGTAVSPRERHASVELSQKESQFVQEAAQGGLAEINLGKLAQQKAASNDVKQFGERMFRDHSKANQQLLQIAQQHGITPPGEPDAKHKALSDKLLSLSGEEFDKQYMTAMVDDHKEDIAKFEEAAKTSQAKDLKQFAQETLPMLKEHLKLAQSIHGRMGK